MAETKGVLMIEKAGIGGRRYAANAEARCSCLWIGIHRQSCESSFWMTS